MMIELTAAADNRSSLETSTRATRRLTEWGVSSFVSSPIDHERYRGADSQDNEDRTANEELPVGGMALYHRGRCCGAGRCRARASSFGATTVCGLRGSRTWSGSSLATGCATT